MAAAFRNKNSTVWKVWNLWKPRSGLATVAKSNPYPRLLNMAAPAGSGGPVRVVDGSMGSQLSDRGLIPPTDALWSARVLVSDLPAIVDVHKSYIRSGADVVTTCSYQANVDNLQFHLGIGASEAEALIARSCMAAVAAREQCGRPGVIVAGSVGPYGAAQADLSEYTGGYADVKSVEELVEWHRPRVRCLVAAGCDVLAFETIPAAREAVALVQLLRQFPGTQAWLSFSTSPDAPHCTAKGEPLAEAMNECLLADACRQIIAIGVNCCPPENVAAALRSTGHLRVPFIAYPNSGEMFSSSGKVPADRAPRRPLSAYVPEWIDLNARWIGGCCGTGPDDISAVAKVVNSLASA
ncbi:homocysteine S-methyltransferase YbgG-like [Dermacentor variabilis]|uniref:homocysteine S-methyltransferase YbgG-like n=1 Tax=Dermacentor variabilis TaxID=34621 RepID=UPI003F5C8F1B